MGGVISHFSHPVILTNLHPLGREGIVTLPASAPEGEEGVWSPWRCAKQGSTNHRRLQAALSGAGTTFPPVNLSQVLQRSPICKSVQTALPETRLQVWIQREKGKKMLLAQAKDRFLQFPVSSRSPFHQSCTGIFQGGWKPASQPTMFMRHGSRIKENSALRGPH